MAERPGGRRRSRRDSVEAGGSMRGTPPASKDRRSKRSSKPSKERWLLTRKTWRYMADAGRRLIPDGTHNRPEDIPKIEQYFQEVCQKEPRFLLWRKASYPGSLGFRSQRRRRQIKGGSCRTKASSADEADDIRHPHPGFVLHPTTAGKFDLAKVKREWLLATEGGSTPSSPVQHRKFQQEDAETKALADMLQKYLNMQSNVAGTTKSSDRSAVPSQAEGKEPFDYQSLIDKLQQHLDLMVAQAKLEELSVQRASSDKDKVPKSMQPYQGDYVHKSLMETISRYYNKSATREHVISDILTDRKLLEKLYFDLRCTRGFRGPRATGAYTSPPSHWWAHQRARVPTSKVTEDWLSVRRDPISPPPLIAVQEPSTDRGPSDNAVQTDPVSREVLDAVLLEKEKEDLSKDSPPQKASGRRRSSVDNDDVSPSVSDTIKRYLRMARKKSMDADKVDRFKRVNYDRNLRNIRPKGEITKLSDDEGNNKGCQTDDNWAVNYREMSCSAENPSENPSENLSDADTATSQPSRHASSRSSIDAGLGSEEPLTPKHHHQSFLSHLLHGSNAHKDKPHSAPGSPALTSSSANSAGGTTMQKSKSSSSVVHQGSRSVARKIWKPRSKSTSRTSNQPSIWTPQGDCTWASAGRRVTLQDTPLRSLSEIERKALCKVAVAKLQALNLGVQIRPPSETLGTSAIVTKPKRRAHLLKRKALTTSFFDNKGKDDKEKDSSGGLVFGIPLSQCLENDRIARIAAGEVSDVGCLSRNSRHGSRTSCTSLIEPTVADKTDEGGSCESLSSKALTGSDSGVLELSDSGGGSLPGEWDAVPEIVRQCIRHLQNSGLRTHGVFRMSPSTKKVRQLRDDFDCGRQTKIEPDQSPHVVAALLKEFFRELPDPLLCRDLYQSFIHTQKIRNRRFQQQALQHLIQLLPTPNRETLWALLKFLNEVAANSEDQETESGELLPGNKMNTNNLATVFAPNILHCVKPGQKTELSVERAEESTDVINVVRALLEHASTLFTVPAALLDEVYLHMMDTHPADLDLALSRRVEEQCGDEVDACSEAETFSVEETLTTSTTTTAGTTTSTKKVWTREECLHQTAGVGGDIGPRHRRPKRTGNRRKEEGRSNSVDSGSSEDPSDRRRSSPMVITASLTIPMSGAFILNLDDPDIPYIEETPKQPSAPPRRQRQRSISGCSEGGRHTSDSSSVTLSGDQAPSSPPSWASSTPTSPDSAVTAVSYIPDQQAVLQRVSFTTSSEVKQVTRANNQETSRSTAAPYTPSITSIGGAVLRSKTADIERMLHIRRPEIGITSPQQGKTGTTSIPSDNKKYTKRRYTDSRHQTRHIPDSETLAGKTTVTVTASSSVIMSSSSSTSTPSQRTGTQPIWKRRELISSASKDRDGYF